MSFSSTLISWYEANKRDLPFRGTRDPYLIWISEVILQQTRMEQGLGYYRRFVQRFPDIHSLASGTEEEVLKLWEGLGYYSRARNLHTSAREIMERMDGVFPQTYEEIRKLKGVGEYTAASVASLAFDESRAAVDGNVYRFLARYYGFREPSGSASGKKLARMKAEELIDNSQPGTFNQAMIEFGALVCTPVNPSCNGCLFNTSCYAFIHRVIREIPVKPRPDQIRKRFFHYLVITWESPDGARILLNKRTGNDIWKNLYDFPQIETPRIVSLTRLMKSQEWRNLFGDLHPVVSAVSTQFIHILSHQVILAKFYRILLEGPIECPGTIVSLEELASLPVPRLISRYLQKCFS
ncbi:MAG: A/G-specific adenine glycosylase [Bacteroidetes bacterium]|nr:MAG: A/G-specific adenine glycosylase [Bacteroidota bacterium]